MVDQITAAMVEIPFLPVARQSYAAQQVETALTDASARKLKGIAAALAADSRALADGRAVTNEARAIEWILEQVK